MTSSKPTYSFRAWNSFPEPYVCISPSETKEQKSKEKEGQRLRSTTKEAVNVKPWAARSLVNAIQEASLLLIPRDLPYLTRFWAIAWTRSRTKPNNRPMPLDNLYFPSTSRNFYLFSWKLLLTRFWSGKSNYYTILLNFHHSCRIMVAWNLGRFNLVWAGGGKVCQKQFFLLNFFFM